MGTLPMPRWPLPRLHRAITRLDSCGDTNVEERAFAREVLTAA
jgi:hypothetical protein